MSLRKAYQDMIKVQGVPDTAMLLDMSESALDNRVYERKGQAFTVRESLRMQEISGTTLFAEMIAALSGGTFIKLPDIPEMDNEALERKFRDLYAKFGRLVQRHTEATEDGEVDARERADLTARAEEIHRVLQELLALTFRIYCRPEPRA